MIFNILKFIGNELPNFNINNDYSRLSILHLDMHKSNMQRAIMFVFENNNSFPKYIVKYPR